MSLDEARVLRAVDDLAEEVVACTTDLVRIPTINPPGAEYETCARAIGDTLARGGFAIEYHVAEGRPEHTANHPRVNVVGVRRGRAARPLVHLNGHFDVVPAGDGWTVDPFAGLVRDGRIYGRGACDMKAGLAAAIYAVEAIRRAGVQLAGSVEVSGTVDEESGGFAGVGWLAASGRIAAGRTDAVIIPEPLDVDRIGIGHRGVYWFALTTHGRIAHGGMPFLGINAIEHMAHAIDALRRELGPRLGARSTAMPVVPLGARYATLNVNAIFGGQAGSDIQTPCVADRCRAVFDRRFLLEETLDEVKAETTAVLDALRSAVPDFKCEVEDLMIVYPVRTPPDSPLLAALDRATSRVLGRPAIHVASPGTYDHKHIARIAAVPHCAAYGPGRLELAHQPDEWCSVDDLITATKVLALTVLDLTAGGRTQ